ESGVRKVPSTHSAIVSSAVDVNTSSFVGRESEIEQVRSGLERVLSGDGQFFCIVGEPGIGKTRLAQEIAKAAVLSGRASVAWGRCWEGGGAPAYWPWIQVVRKCIRASGAEDALASLPRAVQEIVNAFSGSAFSSETSHLAEEHEIPLVAKTSGTSDSARFRL